MHKKSSENSGIALTSCPSCRSANIAERWPTRRIPGNKMVNWCRNCGLGWQHPLPSPSDIRYYYHRFPTYNIHGANEKEQGFRRRIQRINNLMPQQGHLLDIGCGLGSFLNLAIKNGWRVTGIEPQESAAEYCKKHLGIKPHVGTIEEIEFRPGSFDVVTAWDVWEHVHSPVEFIDRCVALLVPNGLLALSIPNASGYPARIFRGQWRYVMFTHLNYFTMPYVSRLMTERGMHFQCADHTIKAQSLLQGVSALLPFSLDTERIIRLGRKSGSESNEYRRGQKDSISKKKANLTITQRTLSWIRQLVLKGNLCPLPIPKGDMMDLFFKKGTS